MVLPFLSGSRRVRFVGFALVLTLFVFWLGLGPLSATEEPFDLHTDPQTPFNGQQKAGDNDVQTPSTSTTGDVDTNTTAYHEPTVVIDTASTSAAPPTSAPPLEPTSELDSEPTSEPISNPTSTPEPNSACPRFEDWMRQKPGPPSEGRRKFPYVRPPPECRTFNLPAMEALIERMKGVIRDPDLFRLFENSYPNTLDTMVKWRGFAKKKNEATDLEEETDEELTYVITGDIDAMWLRDSASQIYSYLPLLEASDDPDSLASLWRGLINSHARYINISPYCHSFQPPPESGIPPTPNAAYSQNYPNPPYDQQLVYDCKWELDSLASFLQISTAYYRKTGDLKFFGKYSWVDAVRKAVHASSAMRLGTYDEEGHVLPSAWTFTGWTSRGSETLTNDGLGNPVKENGMVRSAFRPSDDACIFQLLTPSNMMFAAYLEQASEIMEGLADEKISNNAANATVAMRDLAKSIRHGIALDAVVTHRDFGEIFAYEVDGFGGANLMDDANVPSLLAMPLWNFTQPLEKTGTTEKREKREKTEKTVHRHIMVEPKMNLPRRSNNSTFSLHKTNTTSPYSTTTHQTKSTTPSPKDFSKTAPKPHDYAAIYRNTRRFVLSASNPYFAKGPVLSAVGGPHLGPGKGWPMAATVAALTAYSDLAGFDSVKKRDEVVAEQLYAVLNSTAGTGVVHETVNAWSEQDWTRGWFGWANGLFGELVLRIAEEEEGGEEGLLGRLWQD